MNERTKTILNWLIPVVIAGVIVLFTIVPTILNSTAPSVEKTIKKTGYTLSNPSMILIEFTTRNAISQFGGDMGVEGFNSAVLLGTAGVAVIFVIAPTLMLFGYDSSRDSKNSLRPAGWHLGTAIVLAAVGIGLFSSMNWSIAKNNILESTERQHAMDQLQFELIDLYYDASVKAILPQEKGGGNGHFTNFLANDGSTRTIQLSDLDLYNTDSPFEFVISENVTDSTITMAGVSDLEGNNPDFQNADGRTGRIQMSLTINPYEDDRPNIKRENEWLYATNE